MQIADNSIKVEILKFQNVSTMIHEKFIVEPYITLCEHHITANKREP